MEDLMRHCCKFKPDDIYYLKETSLFVSRKLSVGFCPICNKPVAEFEEISFTGELHHYKAAGLKAQKLLYKYSADILYSMRECNYLRFKSKPFGWKYGINKTVKNNGKNYIKQYAADFYGNKELIKVL